MYIIANVEHHHTLQAGAMGIKSQGNRTPHLTRSVKVISQAGVAALSSALNVIVNFFLPSLLAFKQVQ